jgi:hypothetical protein
MRWPSMVALATLVVAAGACDKIPFLGKKKAAAPSNAAQMAAAPTPDTTKPAPAPAPARAAQTAQAAAPAAPKIPLTDTPWTPVDTGTVAPGMTRVQVIATWGVPVAERTAGPRTYLYFRNGCEVSCGTFDVVFLENDQVVDAIVRGPGHTYSGVSSSPTARTPQEARPGAKSGT